MKPAQAPLGTLYLHVERDPRCTPAQVDLVPCFPFMGDLGAQLNQIAEQLAQFSASVDARLKNLEQPQAALAAPGGSAAGGHSGGAGGAAANQPNPEAELLERYQSVCVALTGCLPDHPLEEYCCDSALGLSHWESNPVGRPPWVRGAGKHFNLLDTCYGQRLAKELGENSPFFHEVAAWAPVASYLFDAVAQLCLIVGHPNFPHPQRAQLVGVSEALQQTLDAALARLRVHEYRAQFDRRGVPAAAGFQAALALEGQQSAYRPAIAVQYDKQLLESVRKAHGKLIADGSTKNAGNRSRGGDHSSKRQGNPTGGKGRGNSNGSNKGGNA